MKNTIRLTLLVLFLVDFASFVNAQDGHRHSRHKHDWPMSDSTTWNAFHCPTHDFSMNDFPFCKDKKRYNGHWAGVELGISGYVTPDFNMNFNPAYPYMNMNTARSLTVNLNPFEINANLYRNHLGFTTGLGFQISNYYFTNNYVMLKDSMALVAYQVQDSYGNPVSIPINKMVVSYLNLPLFFEYQTNPFRRTSSFHVTIGVIAGVRIGSYTKQIYRDRENTYYLIDNNGKRVATYEVDHHVVRDRGAYHLAPFKLDAAFRIGWSHLNLFATYSLTQMFQKNQGPELYPWTMGITLLGW
ncbi:MAG: outer membrane beta-barrel protein [Bacteroidales bacterium]|jgi:hypothetical protein|nr:outer membrane beta-barrel protein [Bacteroidales bacterium]